MSKLLQFFNKIYLFIIVCLVEIVAISYYSNHSLHASSTITAVSDIYLGGISDVAYRSGEYFALKEENQNLQREITSLRNQLAKQEIHPTPTTTDNLWETSEKTESDTTPIYNYIDVKIIGNSVSKQHNFITLNKGTNHGISKDMSLISNGSVIGYIVGASKNFSVAISILNRNFKSSGKAKSSNYFGSIGWDGISSDRVILDDVPKYATIAVGDTIVSSDFSSRFPSGLNIGVIESYELVKGVTYRANLKLLTNMNNIYNAEVIENRFFAERDTLESSTIEEL